MPELSIVYMQMCASNEYAERDIRGYRQVYDPHLDGWTCTCKGFTYRKTCKHIKQAEEERCGWHQQYSDEVQTEAQENDHICPKCGNTTMTVRVGV